jgi:hypothetical protein
MNKKIGSYVFSFFFSSLIFIYSICESKNEELYSNNSYTDHVQAFKRIFENEHINNFLEFGLGEGTGYFLDNCDFVTSVEIVPPNSNLYWLNYCKTKFSSYKNWNPILYAYPSTINIANETAKKSLDPCLYDSSYILDIKTLIQGLFKNKKYDLAFIDPGIFLCGDIVNELFNKVDIIVAHDTNDLPKCYGWNKIFHPSNYAKIVFSGGCGTTFWINKEKKELIKKLVGFYPPATKKLRIFLPPTHEKLTKSLANALRYLGHTLVLPGYSFSPDYSKSDLILSFNNEQNIYFDKDPDLRPDYLREGVEIIENDEILINPPDALIINCTGHENDVIKIWEKIKSSNVKKTKLIYYSENEGSLYNSANLKNLISVDAASRESFGILPNIVCWTPWVDFNFYTFDSFSDDNQINCYLEKYFSSSPSSKNVYDSYTSQFKQTTFGSNVIFSLKKNSLNAYFSDSCATLHIKDNEGFGYTILESLASGRPVFLKKSFSNGKRLMNWCIEGKTAFFFDSYEEFEKKVQSYLTDENLRCQMQKESASLVRSLLDNEKQALILDQFLQRLVD